jgi:hypothetical protein
MQQMFDAGEPLYTHQNSQFPLWDFGECNPLYVSAGVVCGVVSSQFPFWDFGECNIALLENLTTELKAKKHSQFPLWDFGECNTTTQPLFIDRGEVISQFPFWDFFECNTKLYSFSLR